MQTDFKGINNCHIFFVTTETNAKVKNKGENMKKLKLTALICAVFVLCCSYVSAAGESYSWYCVRKKDHVRPTADADLRFIEDAGGAYIGKDEKVVYLTFDAGYENGNVGRILDVLKEKEVRGAFFVLENLIKRDTALVQRMADEGHLVCNHTCSHKNMTKLGKAEFEAELNKLEQIAREEAGIEVAKFYRPPEGRFNRENLEWAQQLGYKTVFWSFAYADWDNNKQPDPAKAEKLILDNVHNGAVLLLHPTSETNAKILSHIIDELKSQGYRFGTLDEIFS